MNHKRKDKERPKLIRHFQSLPTNPRVPLQEFRVRVIHFSDNVPLVDIREFVTTPEFRSFTPKGITLTLAQFTYLISISNGVMDALSISFPVSKEVESITEESKGN